MPAAKNNRSQPGRGRPTRSVPPVAATPGATWGRIVAWLPRIGWGAVVVAFAAVPLVAVGGGSYQLSLPKLTLLLLAALVTLGCWLAWWIVDRPRLPRVRLAIPTGLVVVVTILATVVSVSPSLSVMGINGRYGGLVPLLAMIVIAFGVVAYSWDRPDRRWMLVLAGAASGVVGAVAMLLMRVGVSLGPASASSVTSRPNGLLGNPDFSGAHLALMLPLVLLARRRLPATWAIPVWVAAGATVVAIVLTQSRGAVLAAVIGVAVLGWLDRGLVARAVTIGASVLAVGAVAFVLVSVGIRWTGGDVPLPSGGVLGGDTLASRVDYWVGSAGIVADHPLLGSGPDTFSITYPVHARASADRIEVHLERDRSGNQVPVAAVVLASSPHDIFFERAVGSGLVGLLAYLALGVLAFRYAIRAARRLEVGSDDRVVLAAFAAVMASYIGQGLVSIDIAPMALLGWVALGSIASLADPGAIRARAVQDERVDRADAYGVGIPVRVPRAASLVGAAIVLVLTLVAMTAAVRPWRADHDLAAAGSSSSGSSASGLIAALDAAIALDPIETDLAARAATLEIGRAAGATAPDRDALLRAARRQVDDALARSPGDLTLLGTRAGILGRQGSAGDTAAFPAADDVYRDLVARDPYGPDNDVLWARLLAAWWKAGGDPAVKDRAHTTADRAEPRLDDWATGWYLVATVWDDLGEHDRARHAVDRAVELEPGLAGAAKLQAKLAAGS